MKWFRNMKISAKLIATFLVIAVIAGGVGIFGITSLTNVNVNSDDLFKNYGNSQGYLGYVLGEFQKERALLRDVNIDKDAAKAASTQEAVAASDENLMANLKLFEETCVTPAQKEMYSSLAEKVETFRTVRDDIVSAGVAGDFDKAFELLKADSSAVIITEATEAINTAVASNVTLANDLLKAQAETVSSTIMIMIILVAAAVLIALALGILISRAISKPIRHISEVAVQLAAGDTDVKRTSYESKDEVGQLYTAFREMLAAIQALVADAGMLAESAVAGKLSARADADRHQGDYRKIVEGVNKTLDAVVGPVQEASAVLEEMSKGNLGASVTGDYKGDHALIKESLNSTIGAIKGYISEISFVLGEMSKGNLDVGISAEYRGDFVALKDSINGIVGSLNEVLGEIGTAADQVASGTKQVSDGSQEISQGATEQSSSIEELTASVTQIAEQTRQNAMSANKASELTLSAAGEATRGNESMKAMQDAMAQINEASRSISKIIKVIDDIAFQTNILALNAAVEAARAGVHGKGFAVVAEEVRNLAARSAGAAKETTELIEGSIDKTEAGTRIADETAGALVSIVQGVDTAAQLVREIANASNEQASAITQVNHGIEQLSQVVQTNSATSEEAAAAAEELSSQAELLKSMVGQFNLKNAGKHITAPVIAARASSPALNSAKIDLTDSDFGKY